DKVNPSSLILSGAMMLDYMGWDQAAERVRQCLAETVKCGNVTYDLARQIQGSCEVCCSEFGNAIVEGICRLEDAR
ncbi:MAG: NADP-dependent isocitrate dehydrogenase, partial [Desulfobacteraceae bacterium]|nr:NADP-dependent isocitrate dehydrogenase [Desulfobacteraceae bacterium]